MKTIYTKYIPATNFRGARLKAYTIAGNGNIERAIFVPYKYEMSILQNMVNTANEFFCKHNLLSRPVAFQYNIDGDFGVFVPVDDNNIINFPINL